MNHCLTWLIEIGARSETAIISRYAISLEGFNNFDLVPLYAADVYNAADLNAREREWVLVEREPLYPYEFLANAETEESEIWYTSNSSVSETGRACVDGGIVATVQQLERSHGIRVGTSPSRPVSAAAAASSSRSAVLVGSQPGSRVNVRDGAGINFDARHYGLVGDLVQVLAATTGSDGYTWYQIQFPASGAVGWIRGDLVRML